MEASLTVTTFQPSSAPVRPLQGYFRFRQEMMVTLEPEKRNSGMIVQLWNSLCEEEKARRAEESAQEMANYLALLSQWEKQQKEGLPPIEHVQLPTLKDSSESLGRECQALEEEQTAGQAICKSKGIKKKKSRTCSKVTATGRQ